jgi:exodeoxyribonuclease-5
MQFTPSEGQSAVIDHATEWYHSGGSVLTPLLIQGYAGTGKTSMIDAITDALEVSAGHVSFTGKAASVLRTKVSRSVSIGTIHSAIYQMKMTGDVGQYIHFKTRLDDPACGAQEAANIRSHMRALVKMEWALRDCFAWDTGPEGPDPSGASVLFVDECSMVNHEIGADLMRLARRSGYSVVAIGDPAQLPPVNGRPFFTPEMCDEAPIIEQVVRQRADSPILQLANSLRLGFAPMRGCYGPLGELWVTGRGQISPRAVHEYYHQIICGRNATRHRINREARAWRGVHGLDPQPGERMVVLTNDYQLGVFNGETFTVLRTEFGEVHGRFDDGRVVMLPFNLEPEIGSLDRDLTYIGYGYAITCHKSQGSEHDNVLVIDESFCFPEHVHKWRYTAATRARRHLTFAQ